MVRTHPNFLYILINRIFVGQESKYLAIETQILNPVEKYFREICQNRQTSMDWRSMRGDASG